MCHIVSYRHIVVHVWSDLLQPTHTHTISRDTRDNFGISVATYFSQWLIAPLFILGCLSQQACFFSGNNKLITPSAETNNIVITSASWVLLYPERKKNEHFGKQTLHTTAFVHKWHTPENMSNNVPLHMCLVCKEDNKLWLSAVGPLPVYSTEKQRGGHPSQTVWMASFTDSMNGIAGT